ncbi:MAG: carboxypeptidase regulatory-like domain-containing protein [Rhodobacteraceae bacterium]|jgi:hypothetical protein|nr:carboxypeptidase regulatory-like domain-containing protein [Paracoccaceae bacterium]
MSRPSTRPGLPRRGVLRLAAAAVALPAAAVLAGCVPADHAVTDPGPGPGGAAEGVEGRVTDARGRPVAGAFVEARGTGPRPNPVPEIAVFTDGDGRYRWFLPAGSYAITVTAEALGRRTLAVTVPHGRAVRLDFVLG